MSPPPQPYPGMYYAPMGVENMLTRRNVWIVNAFGLAMIWLAYLLRILSTDAGVLKFAAFLIFSGAVIGALASTAGALGSKKATDMQSVGLFIWAGFLLLFLAAALGAGFFF